MNGKKKIKRERDPLGTTECTQTDLGVLPSKENNKDTYHKSLFFLAMLFLKVEPGGGAGVDLEDGLELLVAGGALGVPLGAELGPVQLSDESGELVAGVGGLGVDVVEVVKEVGNAGLLGGELLLGLGHDLADEHLAAVGGVGGGDGDEEGAEAGVDVPGLGVTLSTEATAAASKINE